MKALLSVLIIGAAFWAVVLIAAVRIFGGENVLKLIVAGIVVYAIFVFVRVAAEMWLPQGNKQ